jgi:hypothetical protein
MIVPPKVPGRVERKTPFRSGFRRVTKNGQNICPMGPCVPADVITSTCKRTHRGRYQYARSPWPRMPGTWNRKIPLYIREWFSQCHKERSKHPSDVSTCTNARRHIDLRAVTPWRPSVRLLGPRLAFHMPRAIAWRFVIRCDTTKSGPLYIKGFFGSTHPALACDIRNVTM